LLEGSALAPDKSWATIVRDDEERLRVRFDEAAHGDVIQLYWKKRVQARLLRHKASFMILQDIDSA
jgi:hypothetical protein